MKSTKSHDATHAFRSLAQEYALDPDDRFVGGYVEHERRHIAAFFRNACTISGRSLLEIGCHYGATAVVAAELGAAVTAIDIDARSVALAKLNAAQFPVQIRFLHVPDTRKMPFADECFDVIVLNSVLEYVKEEQRGTLLHEIDRVLKKKAYLLIHGTSNRLYPREVHSGRWFINYFPWASRSSVNPFWILRQLKGYANVLSDEPRLYFASKREEGWNTGRLAFAALLQQALTPLGIAVSSLAPNFILLLKKR